MNNKFKNYSRAFSLLELMIVIAIIVTIGSIGIGFYLGYGRTVEISSLNQTIISDLKYAQSKSMIGEGGFKYGIHFVNSTNDYYEIFSTPTDYSSLEKVIISTNYIKNNVTFSDPIEGLSEDVIFNKISGSTTPASIGIVSESNTKVINITNIGSISSE